MKILPKFQSLKSSPFLLPDKPILPAPELSAKLFLTGATLGPVVDSLHNQSLLIYDRAPIYISSPVTELVSMPSPSIQATDTYLFCSSWYIPPLLGFAYVVLGAVLPRLIQRTVVAMDGGGSGGGGKEDPGSRASNSTDPQRKMKIWPFVTRTPESDDSNAQTLSTEDERRRDGSRTILRDRAILAVTSTALIIKLSDFLQTNPSFSSAIQETIVQGSGVEIPTNALNVGVMIAAAMTQWLTLDRTVYALLTAVLVGFGGPLSELPFVQYGFWHYIPDAADYTPVEGLVAWLRDLSLSDSGTGFLSGDYSGLAISSITGPCYFAVTMDAIALGRWLENDPNDGTDISA